MTYLITAFSHGFRVSSRAFLPIPKAVMITFAFPVASESPVDLTCDSLDHTRLSYEEFMRRGRLAVNRLSQRYGVIAWFRYNAWRPVLQALSADLTVTTALVIYSDN